MAKISDVYASRFVKSFELSYTDRRPASVSAVTLETFGNDFTQKLVATVDDGKGWTRDLVLNQTNAQRLAAALGNDSDYWVGHKVELWINDVVFQGATMPSVQIGPAPAPALIAPAPVTPPTGTGFDDEIPF